MHRPGCVCCVWFWAARLLVARPGRAGWPSSRAFEMTAEANAGSETATAARCIQEHSRRSRADIDARGADTVWLRFNSIRLHLIPGQVFGFSKHYDELYSCRR